MTSALTSKRLLREALRSAETAATAAYAKGWADGQDALRAEMRRTPEGLADLVENTAPAPPAPEAQAARKPRAGKKRTARK